MVKPSNQFFVSFSWFLLPEPIYTPARVDTFYLGHEVVSLHQSRAYKQCYGVCGP